MKQPKKSKELALRNHWTTADVTMTTVAKIVGKVYQKSQAFDLIKDHRTQLKDLNKRIQALQKSTSKGQGVILSQLLGKKTQIEETIDKIFNSVR